MAAIGNPGQPELWVVLCVPLQEHTGPGLDWQAIQRQSVSLVAELVPTARVLEWRGAIHDVPLQWPALVGGLIASASSTITAEGKVND